MTRPASRMSDVARLAGVSVMTVSRALNGNVKVSPELRIRVFTAAKQLNYQPNEIARSLRDKRSRQIGVIVPYLFDSFFAVCAHAISGVAKQNGYSVVLSTSNEDPRAEYEEVQCMMRRNVEGVIVFPAFNQRDGGRSLLLRAEVQKLAIVVADRPAEGGCFDSVLVDNFGGTMRGTEHLLSLGHRNIVFLGFENWLYTLEARYQGYCAAMQAAGFKPARATLPMSHADSNSAVRKLLARRAAPTAVLCGNNILTRCFLHGLQTLGYSLPQAVALVGFDDFDTADLISPGITVIRQPVEDLGRCAAETLFARLTGGAYEIPHHTVLAAELVIRGSCGTALSASRRIA